MNARTIAPAMRQLASPRRALPAGNASQRAVNISIKVACAALLCWIGYIHLHLWNEGYKYLHINGPLFLLDAIAAFALAGLLLLWPRPLAALIAAAFITSTIGALVISLTVGLFGFHESISASFVVLSLIIESIAVLLLVAWAAVAAGLLFTPPARGA
jgi:hypothetical protein